MHSNVLSKFDRIYYQKPHWEQDFLQVLRFSRSRDYPVQNIRDRGHVEATFLSFSDNECLHSREDGERQPALHSCLHIRPHLLRRLFRESFVFEGPPYRRFPLLFRCPVKFRALVQHISCTWIRWRWQKNITCNIVFVILYLQTTLARRNRTWWIIYDAYS